MGMGYNRDGRREPAVMVGLSGRLCRLPFLRIMMIRPTFVCASLTPPRTRAVGDNGGQNMKTMERLRALEALRPKHITCARDYTYIIDADGVIYSFGSASGGRLGRHASSWSAEVDGRVVVKGHEDEPVRGVALWSSSLLPPPYNLDQAQVVALLACHRFGNGPLSTLPRDVLLLLVQWADAPPASV